METLPPGSLTLNAPGVTLVTRTGPGVTATPLAGGVHFDAPEGGQVRWRVLDVGGQDVIPDADTFVRGLEWRFARVSLPEPAVPIALHGLEDRSALYDAPGRSAALRAGSDPSADPLRPRPLMRVVTSGWATSVERALVLHRLLGQERFAARWVLSGADPDPTTLTGYDRMLVTVAGGGELSWIDPACGPCARGELSTDLLGKPAIGGAPRFLRSGHLSRASASRRRFEVAFDATEAAALWLPSAVWDTEPERRAAVIRAPPRHGGRTLTRAEGLDTPGVPVRVELVGTRPPQSPFDASDPPWSGGWSDAPPADTAPVDPSSASD